MNANNNVGKVDASCVLGWSWFVVTALIMYADVFYGTPFLDEAYYLAQAQEVLNGRLPLLPHPLGNSGFSIITIIIEYVYKILVPDMEGILLFTRVCFVTYKIIVCWVVYKVFRKKLGKGDSLILVTLALPIYVYIQNFSYNTIPIFSLLLSGCLLYDVIEQDGLHKGLKIVISGFNTGLACFANGGYGLSVFVFLFLILIRVPEKSDRFRVICLFLGAIIVEAFLFIAFSSILMGWTEYWNEIFRSMAPIPVDSLNPNKTWSRVAKSFYGSTRKIAQILFPVGLIVYFLSFQFERINSLINSDRQRLIISTVIAMTVEMFSVVYKAINHASPSGYMTCRCAFAAFIFFIIFASMSLYKKEKIVWYLVLNPILYSILAVILLEVNAYVWRFTNSYIVVVPILYVLLKRKDKIVCLFARIMAVILVLTMAYLDYPHVLGYDDKRFLTEKVNTGVLAGIYTKRASDWTEMEAYLNSLIGENEKYAFRDNVPGAYLMMRKGVMCDISTWDCLQYHYHANSPAKLFDYYKRRDMIPNKIIYIDYKGRDKQLSIDDPDFRYNDFVNAYYDLVEDIELNETFKRVKVYQYNGTFDGNYQYWIDTYWQPTKPKKNILS